MKFVPPTSSKEIHGYRSIETNPAREPIKIIQIEATCKNDRLQIAANERMIGEESTIRYYEEITISMTQVKKRCTELVNTLNRANRREQIPDDVLGRLREIGQLFHSELFSTNVKNELRKTDAKYLRLYIDEQLVQIPWELLFDGEQFLCHRFFMGRLVKTQQTLTNPLKRELVLPLQMLILADPEKDLRAAYIEGRQLRDHMDQHLNLTNATLLSDNITVNTVKEKIRNYDVVHFAGHAEYDLQNPENGGWRLNNGVLSTKDVVQMAGTGCMPSLIFSNACQSARTEAWTLNENYQNEIFGLANAFLLSGVKHYIGAFWEIPDEPSCRFSLEFYEHMFSGATIGEALHLSRKALIQAYGEEKILWASYVLYGDPTSNYIVSAKPKSDKPKREYLDIKGSSGKTKTRDRITALQEAPKKISVKVWGSIAAVTFILALFFYFGHSVFIKQNISKYKQKAITNYETGNYFEAMEACRFLQEKLPENPLSAIILGKIYFHNGELKKAEIYFSNVLNIEDATDEEKAEALMVLGRIASIRGDSNEALDLYEQASHAAPEKKEVIVSRAILLNQNGSYKKALDHFEKAKAMGVNDFGITAFANNTRAKLEYMNSLEKQDKIDKLVREIIANADHSELNITADGWTSRPLTVWLVDLKTVGFSLKEGEELLISSGITDRLIEKSRARVVDRNVLDKLLAELEIGTSKLSERGIALSVGKMMAARIIIFGQIVYDKHQAQITYRLIETETSEVKAVVNEVFNTNTPPSDISQTLSKMLIEKLSILYPLRGRVQDVRGNEITINIGELHGVQAGQLFKGIETDVSVKITAVHPKKCIATANPTSKKILKGLPLELIE